MKCPKCKSEKVHKNGRRENKQQYRCTDCGSYFFEVDGEVKMKTPGIGTPLDKWKEKYDVDFIVEKVMNGLDPDMMYEKTDIYKLTGLTPSFPGLSPAIDAYVSHFGKVGGKQHFSHPDTIKFYKEKGRLT